ncbi:urease accessory protein UreF [Scleromatobacter humisilvae]|uniref:Urease accessory protein UreF n=1 Tax=Scleromatobacter humisilvae TaxID=2897159 RepID=A0A9X2C434_9BURK|nr:urease accessory UreF family protein [Scleromatobacter humisilvae]MCK9689254.1 urease accessory protein UreF [Scleromatobacter humisilvae]
MSDAVLLQLMWLASPALPVGGFSYSEALEAAVDDGRVTGEASAADWLANQMALAPARADLPVLAQAHAAWRRHDLARVTQLNDFIGRTRETRELRLQSEQMGRSLVEWLRNQAGGDDARLAHLAALAPSPTWPIAFALATARADASAAQALHASLFGWAENMVQAALKAVPLGQLAGQRILQALVERMPALVEQALAMGDDDMQSFSPMLGIASARHETQYSRLFRS